jgi:hypothetical protein
MAGLKTFKEGEENESGKWKRGGPYKPKNRLDGFLRFALGGKYKWRRYEIFYDYLQTARGHSREEAEAIVARYQENGVEPVYGTLVNELNKWMQLARIKKGKHAIKKRWDKYRAQKQGAGGRPPLKER